MDRESELLKIISEVMKVISGVQDNLHKLTECVEILGKRVDKLEK